MCPSQATLLNGYCTDSAEVVVGSKSGFSEAGRAKARARQVQERSKGGELNRAHREQPGELCCEWEKKVAPFNLLDLYFKKGVTKKKKRRE